MGTLEIKLLGGLNLNGDNLPSSNLKSKKGKALFCYLAVTGKSVPRSFLAGMLWPEMPETNALMNLRKVLTRLKPLFPYLVVRRTNLSFNRESDHWLDIAEFERDAAASQHISRLKNAVNRYQGDFLDGFYLNDAPLFEEWVLAQRARLREIIMGALDALITHLSDQNAYEEAIIYTRRVLAIEPWHERAYRELMRFLVYSGQRGAALVEYENCRRLLAEELNAEPDSATVQLYEQIRKGQLHGKIEENDLPGAFSPTPPLHNLPVQTTPFIGRDRELAELSANLSHPDGRLITIMGPGGMGKTRLALAAAELQMKHHGSSPLFPQGIFFVSLAGLGSPELLVPAIAEAISFRFVENTDLSGQLLRYLRPKNMLLVLDNFEHLLEGRELVADILGSAPGIKLLVTSRARVNLQAEQVFLIKGLDYPMDGASKGQLVPLDPTRYSALQLFQENARRLRPTFALTTENMPAVLDICRMVQGMPLGIILAAAWVGSLSTSEVAERMRGDLDFLVSEMGDVPARQRSLRAAFDQSWRLLNKREQIIYPQLSIFRGSFTRQAASEITGASAHDVLSFVNKSLLTFIPGGRYEVHELLRQFAADRLAQTPALEAALSERHSAFYCNWLYSHTKNWHTSRQLETLYELKQESDNIELALQWALEQRKGDHLAQAIECWNQFLRWQGRYEDGESFCKAVVQAIEKEDSKAGYFTATRTRLLALAMAWFGNFAQSHTDAIERLQQGLALLGRPELADQDIRREKAFILQGLASRYYDLDRRKERVFLGQSYRLHRELDDSWGIANNLLNLGWLAWGTGHYRKAQQHLESGLAIMKKLGDRSEQAAGLNTLAWIYQHLGNLEQAEHLRREVLELDRQLGDRSLLATHTANLAFTLVWQGKYEQALQWAKRSLRLNQEYGRQGGEGYMRLAISFPSLLAGDYQVARVELNQALFRTKEMGSQGVRATVHWSLGCLALVEKSFPEAEAEFIKSRQMYQKVQDNFLGLSLTGLGYANYFMNDLQKSRAYVLESLEFARQLKDYMHLIVTLPLAALFLVGTCEVTRAIQVWQAAKSQPFIAKSNWHAQIVEANLLAAASNLSSSEIENAQEIGGNLDLWETAKNLVNEIR